MNIRKRSAKIWTVIAIVVLGVLGGAAYGVRSYAFPAVKRWRVKSMNTDAREFLAKGDGVNALLLARKSLNMAPQNADAWRIAVTAAKLKKTPEVIVYQDNLCRVEPTKENYLELIRLSLEVGPAAYSYALEGIKATAKDSAADPEYHRLAVDLYGRLGRTAAAKYHLISLSSLVPTDRLVQLKLAAIEMSEDPQRTNKELRVRVRAMANDQDLRAPALALLLREAVDAKMLVDTNELLGRMKAIPDLSVDRQLLVIEASMLVSPDQVDGILERLKSKVAGSPAETIRVLDFLRRTGASKQAWTWYQKLPEKTRQDDGVMRAAGEALFTVQDWAQLETFARGGNWGDFNYLRETWLAYAYRTLGRKADFTDAWKRAVIAAGAGSDLQTAFRRSADLVARVDKWKWEDEHYDVLWKIFSLFPRNLAVRQDLIGWERRQNHTVNLNKLFATIAQLEPNDAVNLNNLTYTSLLLDSNLAQASLNADELVKLEPANPYYATTRAFALYKQGKVQEALEQIQSLGFAARSMPERMLLQALFLAKAGDSERANDLLAGLVATNLLPEEKKLRATAIADIARAERAQGDRNRLQALKRGAETGGWLGLLDPTTQRNATVDMQLADSAYATGDFDGLADMLKKADWGTYQYLSSALLTYLRRQHDGAAASREQWKQTLIQADSGMTTLQNLLRLVSQWSWETERIETLDRLFERNPKDRLVLNELLRYYRENRRVPNILKILTTHLAAVDGDSDERADFAYYSFIANQNSVQAQGYAKQAYDVEPDNVKRALVQVFSLWKQRRYAEAATLLKSVPQNVSVENIPRALITAAVEAETAPPEIARTTLTSFNAKTALPEESALAEQISQRIAARGKAERS
jgi:cellulose synthase operon protein C